MIEVLVNQRELATDSNRVIASCIRLTVSSSYNRWSSGCQLTSIIAGLMDLHSLMAMRNTRAVTESKMLSHLRLFVSLMQNLA